MDIGKDRKINLLEISWWVAIAITPAIVLTKTSFQILYPLFKTKFLDGFFPLILLIFTVIWFIIYMFTTKRELSFAEDFINLKKIKDIDVGEFLIVISLAILFGALMCNYHNFIIFCGLVVLLEFFDLLGNAIIVHNIYISLKTDVSEKNEITPIQQLMYDYYLENPTILRDFMVFFFHNVSLLLSIVYLYTNIEILRYIIYSNLIITITISEIIIFIWRKKRDNRYQKLMSE